MPRPGASRGKMGTYPFGFMCTKICEQAIAKRIVIEEARSRDLKMRTECSDCSALRKARYRQRVHTRILATG